MRHLARKHGFSFLDIDALKKDFDKAGVFLWISMIFYDYLDYYQYGYMALKQIYYGYRFGMIGMMVHKCNISTL